MDVTVPECFLMNSCSSNEKNTFHNLQQVVVVAVVVVAVVVAAVYLCCPYF